MRQVRAIRDCDTKPTQKNLQEQSDFHSTVHLTLSFVNLPTSSLQTRCTQTNQPNRLEVKNVLAQSTHDGRLLAPAGRNQRISPTDD
jgi:hypothetical protein